MPLNSVVITYKDKIWHCVNCTKCLWIPFGLKRGKEKEEKGGEEEVLRGFVGTVLLTWMEYMMILKQRTAKVFPSHREWLSKCLGEHRQEDRDGEDTEDVITQLQE